VSHPHICSLFDVGEDDGSMYLVMEHLEGVTLADRLDKGPLPVEQALTIATAIADGLATPHRQGVIHHDLKPGNVMLTKSGAKLLDFGLAKLKGHGEQPAAQAASIPTRTLPLTAEGSIVGTLQYVAPEQQASSSAIATASTRPTSAAPSTPSALRKSSRHPTRPGRIRSSNA
jgi:serine/threonine protein kinase